MNDAVDKLNKVLDFLEAKIKVKVDEMKKRGDDHAKGFLGFSTEEVVAATGLKPHEVNFLMGIILEEAQKNPEGVSFADGIAKIRNSWVKQKENIA